MLVDFNILPNDSRLWIYASDKELIPDHQRYILNYFSNFIKSWTAHELPLKSGITILKNYFIVIALDEKENMATGCSIDKLQNEVQEVEKILSISLMNRMNIYCVIDNMIECVSVNEFINKVNKETLFYDLTIKSKYELNNWLKKVSSGWCRRLLK